ncbi:efflux transporter periplasmic adaptor subunit [Sphingomonas oleivorans]|uniref:Efflux transporter periplasmic adaptor subunit n=1 Tax=Sphingomonas oleivorans TaxID=1735121 RepID=A0A2T5FXN2_9SPHN|nr:HlyD family secretion protein [Sphingomonas oleivorans]PTQ10876.1 efflux transporter periplasmic adaptor subunit [Sphingomonas oleivorans]
MSPTLLRILRVLMTLTAVLAAIVVGRAVWIAYEVEPWTRDGRVSAEVAQIAADVTGPVVRVAVRDDQFVHKGDLLFEVDPERFRLAVIRAQADIARARAELAQVRREIRRSIGLGDLVAAEDTERLRAKAEQIEADLAIARNALDVARLNLARCRVRATVTGRVANLVLRPGDYATAGHPVLALIDAQTIHIVGYFEEPKIARIHMGDPVRVKLMGEKRPIIGHVQSIAGGIEDRERAEGESLLANVNPTFSWVRLAQRIPVRIAIDRTPPGMRLIAGRTATVEVLPGKTQS